MSRRAPLIGVSTSITVGASPERAYVNSAYLHAVQQAGGVPVPLPPQLSAASLQRLGAELHGLLLTGGGDVDPALFGQAPHATLYDVAPSRDTLETSVLNLALGRGVPVLAVCRGIQVLNVALGGTLYQDVATEPGTQIPHSQKEPRDQPTHKVKVTPGSRLAEILGADELEVNSMHHQAIHRGGVGARSARRGRGDRRSRALRARRAVASGGASGPFGAGPAPLLRARGRGTQILTPPGDGPATRYFSPWATALYAVLTALLVGFFYWSWGSPVANLEKPEESLERLVSREMDLHDVMDEIPRWEMKLYELTGSDPETFEDAIARFDELDEDQRSARTDLDLVVLLAESGQLERAASIIEALESTDTAAAQYGR